VVYDESYELDENELNKIIEKGIVSDAIIVYNLLNKNGTGNFINFVTIKTINLFINFDLNYF